MTDASAGPLHTSVVLLSVVRDGDEETLWCWKIEPAEDGCGQDGLAQTQDCGRDGGSEDVASLQQQQYAELEEWVWKQGSQF